MYNLQISLVQFAKHLVDLIQGVTTCLADLMLQYLPKINRIQKARSHDHLRKRGCGRECDIQKSFAAVKIALTTSRSAVLASCAGS